MGGEVLEELRAISRQKKGITQDQFRIALANMAEIATGAGELQKQVEEQYKRILLAIEAQNINIEAIYVQMNDLKKQIASCENCQSKMIVEQVGKNPFFRLGAWISMHPRIVTGLLSILGMVVLVIFSLWLAPEAQRLTFDFTHWPVVAVDVLAR